MNSERKGLIGLPPLFGVCANIYLCGLDGRGAEGFLQDSQVMGRTVELTRKAVSDFVRSDACRSVEPEEPLHCFLRRDVDGRDTGTRIQSSDHRCSPESFVAWQNQYNRPNLTPLTENSDTLLSEVNNLNVKVTNFEKMRISVA